MKASIRVLALFLALAVPLSAQTVTGRVVEKGGDKPLAFVYVLVPGSETATETDAEGRFSLELEGPSALRFVSESHKALDLVLDPLPGEPLLVELEPLSVELDRVVIVGERETLKTSRKLDERQVERTATGGDPFQLVERAPDVVNPADPSMDNDMETAKAEIGQALTVPVFLLTNPFNYRGLPAYSNAYFMDRGLPLFFQHYNFTGALISSIVPVEVLGGLEMYGNGREASLGPGNGLLSDFTIREPDRGGFSWTYYLSALATGVAMEIPLAEERMGITFSIRKSLYEFTWIPLALLLNDTFEIFPTPGIGDDILLNFAVFPGNVDAYAHFFWKPSDSSRLVVDLLDATGYSTLEYETYNRYEEYSNYVYRDITHQSGGLLTWERRLGGNASYSLRLHEIFSDLNKRFATVLLGGEENSNTYDYPLNDLGGGAELEYLPKSWIVLKAGLDGRWIKGSYLRRSQVDLPFLPGSTGSSESVRRSTTIDTGELSAWAKATFDLGEIEVEPALRWDWFPIIDAAWYARMRGSPTLHAFWYPGAAHSFHLGGGMRYDRFDYFSRQTFLSEQGQAVNPSGADAIDARYVQEHPSRLFNVEADYAWKGKAAKLRLGSYFNYVDELSGFDFQTYVAESNDNFFGSWSSDSFRENAGLKTTKALWSLGANAELNLERTDASLDILYNFGAVRFLADIQGNGDFRWVIPRSDVTHQLKVYGHAEAGRNWTFDGTLKVLVGIPAYRYRVDSVYADPETGMSYSTTSAVPDSIFEFRDYMPRFTFDFKVLFRTDTKPSLEVYADIANLLSFPRYAHPRTETVGFEERSTLDRAYDWTPIYLGNFLKMRLDIGARLKM